MIAKILNQNTIQVNDLNQFDPYAILHSGQVFRYWQTERGWLVMSGNHWAEIGLNSNQMIIKCDDAQYFYRYFDFSTDYQIIKQNLNIPKLQNALVRGGGIRILQAEFVEMVLSFIISANNNIKRFTKTINAICERYGDMTACGQHAFPSLEQCAMITEEDFKQFGCGYRAPYLVKAIQQLKQLNFNQLQKLDNHELQRILLEIYGVGPKVAACIMLFAFHRLDVAPVDTWIKKAIAQLSPEEQNNILCGPYAGIAQQYIFYYLQHLHKEVL